MPFDWYQATVPAFPSYCENLIISAFDGAFEECRPINGFKTGRHHQESGISMYHGGHNPLPHLKATGDNAPAAAAFIRSEFPAHKVSRVDVCRDMVMPRGFEIITGLMEPIARASGVAVTFYGDPREHQTGGRTMYYGSKTSDVRLVVYEKGLQKIAEGHLEAHRDWVRVELRVRPRKDRKALCARLSEDQMWGMARWSTNAANLIFDLSPEFRPDLSIRQTTAQQSFAHMLRQYQGVIRAVSGEIGREAVLAAVQDVLDG